MNLLQNYLKTPVLFTKSKASDIKVVSGLKKSQKHGCGCL
jgi:hypothetical protein